MCSISFDQETPKRRTDLNAKVHSCVATPYTCAVKVHIYEYGVSQDLANAVIMLNHCAPV